MALSGGACAVEGWGPAMGWLIVTTLQKTCKGVKETAAKFFSCHFFFRAAVIRGAQTFISGGPAEGRLVALWAGPSPFSKSCNGPESSCQPRWRPGRD